MKKLVYTILIFAIMWTIQMNAQKPVDTLAHKKVEVRVDGLSCPFCAYGLEKKAIGIDGVDSVKIDVTNGLMTLKLKD
jgi:mercuric ion binding protein